MLSQSVQKNLVQIADVFVTIWEDNQELPSLCTPRSDHLTMDRTCNLNNSAVSSLASGELQEAIVLFEQGLHTFNDEMDEEGFVETLRSPMVIQPFQVHPSLACNDGDTFPMVYTKAFCLLSGDHLSRDEVATTLLFNFGLALQVQGITENAPNVLKKAGQMYSMATSILEEIGTSTFISSGIVLLALSVWNNIGSLFSRKADHAKAAFCIQQMSEFLEGLPMMNVDAVFFRNSVQCLEICGKPGSCSPAA